MLRGLDIFCGVGGSSTGAQIAGVRILCGIDTWTVATATYGENFPAALVIQRPLERINLSNLKRKVGEIDILLASPECTSHTCAKGSAPRSEVSRRTAFQVIRFAKAFKPRWIVVENVVHMRRWRSYETWRQTLAGVGYNIREQVINAADHGVPQARRRLFVMCDRERTPSEVKRARRQRRIAASIVKRNGFKFSDLRSERRAPATIQRAQRALAAVGRKQPFLLVYYGSDAAGGWQRLDVPLRTLTTLDRFAYVRPTKDGHEMRMLQVPEIKAAMGFPAEYALGYGTRRERIKLLGNAVCPPVMAAVIRTLTRALPTR